MKREKLRQTFTALQARFFSKYCFLSSIQCISPLVLSFCFLLLHVTHQYILEADYAMRAVLLPRHDSNRRERMM